MDTWKPATEAIRRFIFRQADSALGARMFLDPRACLEFLPVVVPFSPPPGLSQQGDLLQADSGGRSRMESRGIGGH